MRQPVSQQRVRTGPDGSRFRHTPATEAKRRTRQIAEGDTLWDLRGLLGELSPLQRRVFEFPQLRQRNILPSSATSARLPAKAMIASA